MDMADFPYMRLLIPPIMGVNHMIRERYPPFYGGEKPANPRWKYPANHKKTAI